MEFIQYCLSGYFRYEDGAAVPDDEGASFGVEEANVLDVSPQFGLLTFLLYPAVLSVFLEMIDHPAVHHIFLRQLGKLGHGQAVVSDI